MGPRERGHGRATTRLLWEYPGVSVAGLETVSLPVVARILTFAIKKPSFLVTQSLLAQWIRAAGRWVPYEKRARKAWMFPTV